MPKFFMSIFNEDDKSKVEEIWHKYHGIMLIEARKWFNSDNVVEDAVSEAFIRIIKNIKKIKKMDILCHQTRAYFVTIVKNVCIDILRKESKRMEVSDEILEWTPGNQADVLKTLVDKEGFMELKKSISSLSAPLRVVFDLAMVQKYTHGEIAEVLKINEATSKKRLQRAKEELRKKLAGGDYGK